MKKGLLPLSPLSCATPDSPSTDHLHQGQASSGKWERKKKKRLIKADWGLLEPLPNAISQTFCGSSGNFCSHILQGTAHPQDRRTGPTLRLINPCWVPKSHPSGTPCPFLHFLCPSLRMGMYFCCSSPSQCLLAPTKAVPVPGTPALLTCPPPVLPPPSFQAQILS